MTILWLLAFIVLWNALPLVLITRLELPEVHKARAVISLLGAAGKGLLIMLPDLLAPVVVAIALCYTHRNDEQLPPLFRWWDNDVSINGDQAEGAPTYYALGHDRRSFWARYVWLGWRNRASWLSQRLGHTWQPGEQEDRESWGDPLTGRSHAGWSVNRCAGLYQLYIVKRMGSLCLRINYGHKVWAGYDLRPVANVVNISFSILRWRGA